ncbi:hypothetical protein EON63_12180 [archaeon]|nr:MAG: hypothetical protein EON63_12180 [archaeon]
MTVKAVFIHRYEELPQEELSIGFFEVDVGQQDVSNALKDHHILFDFAKENVSLHEQLTGACLSTIATIYLVGMQCPALIADMEKVFQNSGGDVHREYYGFVCDDIKSTRFMVEMKRDLGANLRAYIVD